MTTPSHHNDSSHLSHDTESDRGTGSHRDTGKSVPRVLSIAGTDPSGGAGTAADLSLIHI